MYNDITVRNLILAVIPMDPWRIEMEDIDYGERMGIFYRSPDKGIIRHAVVAKGRKDQEIADEFIALLEGEPRVIQNAPRYEFDPVTLVTPVNYEGKRGRHPSACICTKCTAKKALNGQATAA